MSNDKEKLIAEIEAWKTLSTTEFAKHYDKGLNQAITIIRKRTPQPDANAELVEALEEIEGLTTDDFETDGFLTRELPENYEYLWISKTKEIAREALAKHKAPNTAQTNSTEPESTGEDYGRTD